MPETIVWVVLTMAIGAKNTFCIDNFSAGDILMRPLQPKDRGLNGLMKEFIEAIQSIEQEKKSTSALLELMAPDKNGFITKAPHKHRCTCTK